MSGTSPPGDALLPARAWTRRMFWGCLAAGTAIITVVVPPLVASPADRRSPDIPGVEAAAESPNPSASAPVSADPSGPASTPTVGAPRTPTPTTGPASTGGGAASSQTSAPAQAAVPLKTETTTSTLLPLSITTTAGYVGDGQSVANLRVRDLSGKVDGWERYVEFSSGYAGYLTFTAPANVAPSTVTGVQVLVNYRGPAISTQTWAFRLRNQSTGGWVEVGTNELAPDWGAWTTLSFGSPGAGSAYVSAQRTIQLQITGSSARDTADLDYVAVILTRKV